MPDASTLLTLGATIFGVLVFTFGLMAIYAMAYVKVGSGQVLIVNKMAEIQVFFTGGLAIPTVHKAEVMDISAKSLVIERSGSEGLICKDGIRANLRASFQLRVNKTIDDILRVAQHVGTARAMEPETLRELFLAKFSEALESVAIRRPFADHYEQRETFIEEVLTVIGDDLHGYTLDALTIDRLEQTPIDCLDKNNILDAKGILAITKSVTEAQTRISELKAAQSKRMKELETEAKELLVELESRQASALMRLGESTGKTLSAGELDDRLLERLRELVDVAVEARFTPQA